MIFGRLFWWAHIWDIDFMALPKRIIQGFQHHGLERTKGRGVGWILNGLPGGVEPTKVKMKDGEGENFSQNKQIYIYIYLYYIIILYISHSWRLKMIFVWASFVFKKRWNCSIVQKCSKEIRQKTFRIWFLCRTQRFIIQKGYCMWLMDKMLGSTGRICIWKPMDLQSPRLRPWSL